MRIKVLATVALLLGILLATSVALAGYPADGVGVASSETWVMNVHETLAANVVATYVDQDGFQTGTTQTTIAPLGHDSFPASSPDLESGWLGSMTIDSLRPIASIVENIFVDVPTGDNWGASAFNDVAEGAQEIIFPGVAKTGCWRSYLTVQCVDTEDCEVFMTYRDEDGNLVSGSPFLDTIESYSQETYDVWDATVNPNIPNDTQMPANWWGSLQVTSTQSIAGVARSHCCKGYSLSYNAVPSTTATEIFFPGYVRRNWADWGGQSDWSNISVYNLNDIGIIVHLNFYKDSGDSALYFTDTIPARGSHSYNAKTSTQWPFDELPNPFIGSAVVTSTHPIVGSGSIVRAPSGGVSGGHYGFSEGYQTLVFPVAYRLKDGATWRRWSGVGVQNVDPNNEITVHVYWLDPDGTEKAYITDTVKPYASGGYSTKTDDPPYNLFGADWTGTVVVTTTSPAGVAGLILNQTVMPDYMYISQYNGIPVE
jgi:hypothetical protein